MGKVECEIQSREIGGDIVKIKQMIMNRDDSLPLYYAGTAYTDDDVEFLGHNDLGVKLKSRSKQDKPHTYFVPWGRIRHLVIEETQGKRGPKRQATSPDCVKPLAK